MNGGTLRLTGHICQKAWLDVSLGCVEGCGSRCMQDLDAILQRSRSAIQRSIFSRYLRRYGEQRTDGLNQVEHMRRIVCSIRGSGLMSISALPEGSVSR